MSAQLTSWRGARRSKKNISTPGTNRKPAHFHGVSNFREQSQGCWQKDASRTLNGARGVLVCAMLSLSDAIPKGKRLPVISSVYSSGPGSGHVSFAASAYQCRIAGVASTAST
jgi:hypothetical protein